jgi:hypothetical protein
MSRPIIALTTDFGTGSPYVAAMKGVILSINADVAIVDLTHAVPPQDIRNGALALAQVAETFPAGTIHVAVVDPGVGTERCLVYASIHGQHFVAPDNGVLDGLARHQTPDKIVVLTNPRYWRPEVSATFHGRDIMAPVAAHLSLGVDPDQLGDYQQKLTSLDWPEVHIVPGRIDGSIQSIDSFGNLVTDITEDMLGDAPRDETVTIRCDEHETQGIFAAYGEQPPMTLIALVGSSGFLEMAIVDDSAKIMLGVAAGTPVTVTW